MSTRVPFIALVARLGHDDSDASANFFATLMEGFVDNATYYRAMRGFCLQRAKIENESRIFWETEALYWAQRLTISRMTSSLWPKFPDGSWWS